MKQFSKAKKWLLLALAGIAWAAAQAQDRPLGADVDSLLNYAREHNPDYAGMRLEAQAAAERIVPAGALPDPRFRTELRDITRGGEQGPALAPGAVGSTRYLLMQDVPWFGKRDLKREAMEFEAEGAKGRAMGTWTEIATKIKTTYAQLHYLYRNERLTREVLDLMVRLEQIAQARYANGLSAQQDVIRAQVEQTAMRNDLFAQETERHHMHTRLNALLARPAAAPLAEPQALRPLPQTLDPAALEERVRARNPLLFAEESRVKAAEKNRELTYKNRYPDFTFGISPIQYQNTVNEWELMVELNIPLQQGTRRAQERESEAMLSAAQARKEATANQLLSDLSEFLAELETARKTETLIGNSLLPQAELTLQAALAGYETGKVDFATLLDAQRQIRQAKQNRLKAQADGQTRLAEIERLLGESL